MITFLGDVALLSDTLDSQYRPLNPYIINFEYVTGDGELTPIDGKINLYSANRNIKEIFGKQPVAAVIANNHTLDYGEDGLKQTVISLHNMQVPTIGDNIFFFDKSTCILAYSMVGGAQSFQFSHEKVKKDLASIPGREEKRIIVNMHWGIENSPCESTDQQEAGRWLIDNGVDLVIGHHPHCIQPIEKYKDKYICYSLGNCLFPNFALDSHFANGIATRKYRFKWRHWNRESIAINYDEKAGTVTLDELYMQKNQLICKRKNISPDKYSRIVSRSWCKIVYTLRKYWLFLVSNSFVDGKLFDINALKMELNR